MDSFIPIVLLFVVAFLLLFWGRRGQQKAGLPTGRVIYADPSLWGKNEQALYDPETGLTGKPDYLVRQGGRIIPVEVKSGFAPAEPYAGHLMQLMAYCYLVEQVHKVRPPYGILHYRNRTFSVDYTPAWEERLHETLEEMRHCEKQAEVDRSHDEVQRCARCGYRRICDQDISHGG